MPSLIERRIWPSAIVCPAPCLVPAVAHSPAPQSGETPIDRQPERLAYLPRPGSVPERRYRRAPD